MERALHRDACMYVVFDHEQVVLLRQTLQHALTELRVESARSDSTDYRKMLHQREDVIEQLLAKLSDDNRAVS